MCYFSISKEHLSTASAVGSSYVGQELHAEFAGIATSEARTENTETVPVLSNSLQASSSIILDGPYQPDVSVIVTQQRKGQQTIKFQSSWYKSYPWAL